MTSPTATLARPATRPVGRRLVARDDLARRYRRQTRARARRLDLLTVLAWVSVAIAVAFFLADGGVFAFTSVAASIRQLGIIAGLVATDLCVLMFLLSARIPLVDATIGHDRALAAHRLLGAPTIIGLALHGVLLVIGEAWTLRVNVLAELGDMLTDRDLLWAILAVVGMGIVGVSSFQAARRKLGFEVWQAIHLLTYGSIALSIPHQFSQGLFAEHTLQRWYWAALLTVTAFAILAFRVFLPLISTFQHRLRVVDVTPAGPGAVSITMAGRDLDALGARAGHFLTFRFLGRGLWWHAHPFSLSAAPTASTLRITVRDLGAGSAALQHVGVGTRVSIQGPYGRFTDAARTTARGLVLVGAGIGIAPLRALLEGTATIPGATTVILRASTIDELYLIDEIEALCRTRGATLLLAVGRRGTGWLPAGWEGHTVATLAPQVATSDVYVCGPEAWGEAVRADARACGVPARQLHDERFSW